MARLELCEREISLTQSAEDRRAGVWHVWSNDPYWTRRLESVGAMMVRDVGDGKDFTLSQRQVLIRKVPAKRTAGPRVIEFLQRKKDKTDRVAVEIRADEAEGE